MLFYIFYVKIYTHYLSEKTLTMCGIDSGVPRLQPTQSESFDHMFNFSIFQKYIHTICAILSVGSYTIQKFDYLVVIRFVNISRYLQALLNCIYSNVLFYYKYSILIKSDSDEYKITVCSCNCCIVWYKQLMVERISYLMH